MGGRRDSNHYRPDHAHRRPSADRLRGRQRQGDQRLVIGADVARDRNDPPGPRSPRRLAVHPAHLRRLHHGPRHRLGAGGGERPEPGSAAQRPVHPQPDHHRARHPRSHRAFLPAHGLDWVDIVSALSADPAAAANWAPACPTTGATVCRKFARFRSGSRRSWGPANSGCSPAVTGASGHETAAGSESAGRDALSASAGVSADRESDRRHSGFQDPAHSESGGRGRGQPHQSEQSIDPDPGAAVRDQGGDRQARRVRQRSDDSRRGRRRRAVRRLDRVWGGRHRLSVGARSAAGHQGHAVRVARRLCPQGDLSRFSRSRIIRTNTSAMA
jgi:hypothetical protein